MGKNRSSLRSLRLLRASPRPRRLRRPLRRPRLRRAPGPASSRRRVVRRRAAIRAVRRRGATRQARRHAATREARPPATPREHREDQEVRAARAVTREAPGLRARPVRRRPAGTVRDAMLRGVRAVRVPAATGRGQVRVVRVPGGMGPVVRVRAATGRADQRCSAPASGPSVHRNAATAARCGRAAVPVVPAWAAGPRVPGRRPP